jgi:hypothetical protein
MRQGSEISFVLGAYIGMAHTVTVNSLNETIQYNTIQWGLGHSVANSIDFLLDRRLDRYRFIYVDSHNMGCRYWV